MSRDPRSRVARRAPVLAIALALALASLTACGSSKAAPSSNRQGCVHGKQTGDLFPTTSSATVARNFSLSYHRTYKVLNLRHAGPDFKSATYVLYQCGTKAPALGGGLRRATKLQIPVTRAIVGSTTEFAGFADLGQADRVAGVDTTKYLTGQAARKRAPKLVQFAPDGTPIPEKLVSARPDVVLDDGYSPDLGSTAAKAGLTTLLDGSNQEPAALGRAEWIKVFGALTNQEKQANQQYEHVAANYHRLAAKTANLPTNQRPTVMAGYQYEGRWANPGGATYTVKIMGDAGARYVWNDHHTAPTYVSLEAQIRRAHDATYWINGSEFWTSLHQMLSEEPRYKVFSAWKHGRVWTTSKGENKNGGQPYNQEGIFRPDLVLGDMIAIFHPNLAKGHHFAYYEHLPKS